MQFDEALIDSKAFQAMGAATRDQYTGLVKRCSHLEHQVKSLRSDNEMLTVELARLKRDNGPLHEQRVVVRDETGLMISIEEKAHRLTFDRDDDGNITVIHRTQI